MAEKPLFNLQEGLTGRDGGPYLDQQEAREAETRRAVAEGREPDYENLSGTAGIPQVTAGELAANSGTAGIASQAGRGSLAEAVEALAEENTLVKPTATGQFPDPDDTFVVGSTTVSRDVGEDEDEETVRQEQQDLVPEQDVPETERENIPATTNESPNEDVTKNSDNLTY